MKSEDGDSLAVSCVCARVWGRERERVEKEKKNFSAQVSF